MSIVHPAVRVPAARVMSRTTLPHSVMPIGLSIRSRYIKRRLARKLRMSHALLQILGNLLSLFTRFLSVLNESYSHKYLTCGISTASFQCLNNLLKQGKKRILSAPSGRCRCLSNPSTKKFDITPTNHKGLAILAFLFADFVRLKMALSGI